MGPLVFRRFGGRGGRGNVGFRGRGTGVGREAGGSGGRWCGEGRRRKVGFIAAERGRTFVGAGVGDMTIPTTI